MWLITNFGFFSVVQKPSDVDSERLTIRSRTKKDLERLRKKYLPDLGEILEGAGTDYKYRAQVLRASLVAALPKMINDIDYSNFKDSVAKNQGSERAETYGKVWNILHELQDNEESFTPHPNQFAAGPTHADPVPNNLLSFGALGANKTKKSAGAMVTRLLSELVDHVEATNVLYRKNFVPGLGTHPIPFFGNPLTAKVITVGVNPSATEFSPERKWPKDITLTELQERLVHYYNLKKPEVPPHKWFEKWEECLNVLGCSYKTNTAHLDLSPRATISMGKVPDNNLFLEMLKADARWFWRFLECSKSVRLLLIAGSATKKHYIYEFMRKVMPQECQFIGNFKRLTGCKNSGWARTFLLKMPKKNIFVFFVSVSPSAQNSDRMIDHIEKNKDDLKNLLRPAPS